MGDEAGRPVTSTHADAASFVPCGNVVQMSGCKVSPASFEPGGADPACCFFLTFCSEAVGSSTRRRTLALHRYRHCNGCVAVVAAAFSDTGAYSTFMWWSMPWWLQRLRHQQSLHGAPPSVVPCIVHYQ